MKSQVKLEQVGDDSSTTQTTKKPQQYDDHHHPQDSADEVETDIETPLSSPEREPTASCNSNSSNSNSNSSSADKITSSTEAKPKSKNGQDGDALVDQAGPSVKLKNGTVEVSLKTEEEEEEEDYSNWPLRDIKDPHGNDVLYGRGGGTNHHPGNKRYRKIVEGRKVDYVNSKRLDKPLVALDIIKGWRTQVPPGRFLKIDEQTGLWHDVGDRKAREKTSQALREKAPLLRKQQEEQRKEKLTTEQELAKSARFGVPIKNNGVKRPGKLERDHTFGRGPVEGDLSVKGFDWDQPLDVNDRTTEDVHLPKHGEWENSSKSKSWEDRIDSEPSTSVSAPYGPSVQSSLPNPYVAPGVPGVGADYAQPPTSQDAIQPPGYSSDWQQLQHNPHTPKSNHTMMNEWRGFQSEDLARKSYGGDEQEYRHSRSADDAYRRSKRGYYHDMNSDNSHLHSVDYERVATIVGPNAQQASYMHSWTNAATPSRSNSDGMYKTNPDMYDTSRRSSSSGMYDASSYHSPDRMPPANYWASPQPHPTHSHSSPQSSIEYYNHNHPAYHPTTAESYLPGPAPGLSPMGTSNNNCIPRPPTVKRDTSHKLETIDVEPTTKRMNRQISLCRRTASMSSVDEITEKDIKHLNSSLEQSSLAGDETSRPQILKESDRMTTIDRFIVNLDGQSSMLDLGLKDERPGSGGSLNIGEVLATNTRPNPLSGDDRVSTLGTIDSDLFSGLTNAAPV